MQQPIDGAQKATRQIARAAGIVITAYLVTTPIRFLATIMAAQTFGTGSASEAFWASNRFSEILFNLVAGGALGSAFIPTFTGLLTKNDHKEAWKLASSIANLVLLVMTLFSILTIVFAREVVHYILAPGFSAVDPAKEILTADLLRIQVPSAVIFGLSGLVMGILNANQRFLLPALAPAMYNIGWIIGLVFLVPTMGIFGLAWGVLLGAGLHLVIQIPNLFSLPNRKFSLTLGLDSSSVREVARLMLPRLLGVATVQLNFLLNTYLASLQPEGSVTAISLAWPLMLMPQAAIAQSIATAALPTFSAQYAKGKIKEMRSSLASTLRGVLILSIPATLGLILLREPIIVLLYQNNEFNAQSTQLVSWALLWYTAGLVGHCVVEIISRAFYALHNTKTPVLVGIGAMSLNLIFSLLFSALFSQWGWMPHGGLALANSLATALEGTILLILMHHRLKGLEGKKVVDLVIKALIASGIMSAGIWAWLQFSFGRPTWQVVLGGVAVGGMIYGLLIIIMRVEEVNSTWKLIRDRLHI
jgi:putative peptidoglycan lipid II flippase